MSSVVLRAPGVDADRLRLTELETQLDQRERELFEFKRTLQRLQSRYLGEVGAHYRELSELEAQVVEAEIRAGIRPPPSPYDVEADEEAGGGSGASAASCGSPAAPSVDLKRIFRDVAKAIHPDLALDEPARCRRHSLMAEANRAYAERDEDRLRLILNAWERSPEAVLGDGAEADDRRVRRRIAEIDERLMAIEAETSDLKTSAIWRLKGKIDDARAQGWDLFAEMVLQVRRELARAKARLASLRRSL